MRILSVAILAILMASCVGDSEDAYTAILEKEDSIAVASAGTQMDAISASESSKELINQLDKFVNDFPEDERAPECLDKIHMAYSGLQDYEKASIYADRVLKEYPDYINRAMVLESQANNYDMFIQPRDTAKVRYYSNLLLKENITESKKKEIRKRLQNLHLTMEQYIMAQ